MKKVFTPAAEHGSWALVSNHKTNHNYPSYCHQREKTPPPGITVLGLGGFYSHKNCQIWVDNLFWFLKLYWWKKKKAIKVD